MYSKLMLKFICLKVKFYKTIFLSVLFVKVLVFNILTGIQHLKSLTFFNNSKAIAYIFSIILLSIQPALPLPITISLHSPKTLFISTFVPS